MAVKRENETKQEITLAIFLVLDLIFLQWILPYVFRLNDAVSSLGSPFFITFVMYYFFLIGLLFAIFCVVFLEIKLSKKGGMKKFFEFVKYCWVGK